MIIIIIIIILSTVISTIICPFGALIGAMAVGVLHVAINSFGTPIASVNREFWWKN
jgi:hypothetical protein